MQDMEKTLISIIVPMYNSQNTIEKCIDSILNQTFSNFEACQILKPQPRKIKGQIVICPFILMSPKTQRASAEQFPYLFVSSYSFVQKAPPDEYPARDYP